MADKMVVLFAEETTSTRAILCCPDDAKLRVSCCGKVEQTRSSGTSSFERFIHDASYPAPSRSDLSSCTGPSLESGVSRSSYQRYAGHSTACSISKSPRRSVYKSQVHRRKASSVAAIPSRRAAVHSRKLSYEPDTHQRRLARPIDRIRQLRSLSRLAKTAYITLSILVILLLVHYARRAGSSRSSARAEFWLSELASIHHVPD